jgi:hypothetical protein
VVVLPEDGDCKEGVFEAETGENNESNKKIIPKKIFILKLAQV